MKSRSTLFVFSLILIIGTSSCIRKKKKVEASCGVVSETVFETDGREVFDENCAKCHDLMDKSTGPALYEFCSKNSHNYFKAYIFNQDSLIKIEDERTIKNRKEYQLNYIHNIKLDSADLAELISFLSF